MMSYLIKLISDLRDDFIHLQRIRPPKEAVSSLRIECLKRQCTQRNQYKQILHKHY